MRPRAARAERNSVANAESRTAMCPGLRSRALHGDAPSEDRGEIDFADRFDDGWDTHR